MAVGLVGSGVEVDDGVAVGVTGRVGVRDAPGGGVLVAVKVAVGVGDTVAVEVAAGVEVGVAFGAGVSVGGFAVGVTGGQV